LDAHAGAVGVLGLGRGLVGVGLDLARDLGDGGVELRVAAVLHLGGVVDDLDVGVDAVALDAPGAVLLVEAAGRGGDAGPVEQAGVAGDADEAAPGGHAYELAELRLAEVPGEGVAAGAGQAVDEHGLGALLGVGGPGPVVAVAAGPVVGDGAVEHFDEAGGD